MKERLQKIIAASGVTSRRGAETMILDGRVTCNGRICTLGESADPHTDVILLDGKPLPSNVSTVYLMLNKPRGYVTTLSDEKGRANVAQLVADCGQRVYPVGRLDMDSEGLLIMTNDGAFANELMHPKHLVDKVYRVVVTDYTMDALEKLKLPVLIDGYRIHPPKVRFLRMLSNTKTKAELEVTIHEGRNRQVRKMCALAGMSVHRLRRIAEGELQLGDLPLGKWRYLTEAEVASFKK